jgi:hypothetical protein
MALEETASKEWGAKHTHSLSPFALSEIARNSAKEWKQLYLLKEKNERSS